MIHTIVLFKKYYLELKFKKITNATHELFIWTVRKNYYKLFSSFIRIRILHVVCIRFRIGSRYNMIMYCTFITFDISAHLIQNSLKLFASRLATRPVNYFIFFARNAYTCSLRLRFVCILKLILLFMKSKKKKNKLQEKYYLTRFAHLT